MKRELEENGRERDADVNFLEDYRHGSCQFA